MSRISIIARPRIHISLADLGFASGRGYGGIGFSLNQPKTVWHLEAASECKLSGCDSLDVAARDDVQSLSQKLIELSNGHAYSALLTESPPQHTGFGSKTSLLMSLIAGVNKLFNLQRSPGEMQALAGRGGASGVGINAFFTGGVVWDGGHKVERKLKLLPSSRRVSFRTPPLLARWEFPEQWKVALIVCEDNRISADSEERFFEENTPIPAQDALKTMAALYHGVVPAFSQRDLEELASALRTLHSIGFKAREVRARSRETQSVLKYLHEELGVAAGMSSLGPLIYVVFHEDDRALSGHLDEICLKHHCKGVSLARGYNSGFDIISGLDS